jgi:2-iminobutanoate/2-iminopropanoate deaminase
MISSQETQNSHRLVDRGLTFGRFNWGKKFRRARRLAERPARQETLMPKKEVIHVNLAAANPNLSPATRFGNLVFVAGQTGRHPVSGEVGKGVREQTHYALQRVKTILEVAGTCLDNVLTVTTHLTTREDLPAYNEEYAKFFPTNKPARTTVEVMLNSPDLLVEITVTACIPD